MDREYLIQKWLDHALNAEELEAFKKLDDYDALIMLNQDLQKFKAPSIDEKQIQKQISENLVKKKQNSNWQKSLLRIAAIVVVALGGFWFLNQNQDTNIKTLASEKTSIKLPDASEVTLNASSNLIFNSNTWEEKRELSLDGEAYFKVAKGSTFEVKTNEGNVTVLGTQFNVKQRGQYFEVVCYEGLVNVSYNENETKLHPKERIIILDGTLFLDHKVTTTKPSWIHNESKFNSLPYKYILEEFERQYNVVFITKNVDLNTLFTGSFAHDNYQTAIKSITLPLHITYSKNDNTITLKRE